MRTVLRSWWLITALLLVAATGTGLALRTLQAQTAARSDAQAIETAEDIVFLSVHRNLGEALDARRVTLTVEQGSAISGDVAELQRHGRLVGLEIWRADGELLYADANHTGEAPRGAGHRTRIDAGGAWVEHSRHSERKVPTVGVSLPLRSDEAGDAKPAGFVDVLLPAHQLTDEVARTGRLLDAAAAGLLLLVAGILVVLRRRLMARDHAARHDGLTGLLNRDALLADAPRRLAAAARDGRHAALLVLDLDGFKSVNDTLGHAAGDVLLTQVATTLRRAVRPDDLVARLGGDEFAVLVSDLPSPGLAAQVAQNLLAALRRGSFAVHGVELAVDASIGIALAPDHGDDVDALLQKADVAMYQAKRAHTGADVYDPATDEHDVGQLALLVELRRAIDADELVLHYQPKVALPGGEITGVEALVRWQHPTRGLLGPGAFLPLAENTGLMQPLTDWVVRRAVAQAASWRRAGSPLTVAVNISPRSLLDGDLPGTVLGALAEAGLPAALLELEITETAVMTDPNRAADVVRHLAAMGVEVGIDDFGAGYTSLAFLRTLPVRVLKIDRSFVTHMLEREQDEAVTEAVIGLGHRLGMAVLAEGVESAPVRDRLAMLRCDEMQGYLLTPPLAPDRLEGWLTEYERQRSDLLPI